jgi:starch synthase
MISLRYGTVPIVRGTGGLADTVTDVTASPKTGTGFVFDAYTTDALLAGARRAIAFFRKGRGWTTLQQRGMSTYLSWEASASDYAKMYALARRR